MVKYLSDVENHSNTSHVNLYPDGGRRCISTKAIQIHLMLIFIDGTELRGCPGKRIQIHLMLIFIVPSPLNVSICFNSNTSHVNLYRKICGIILPVKCIQIHLMLIFIPCRGVSSENHRAIQIHLMLIFIRCRKNKGASQIVFKYISC